MERKERYQQECVLQNAHACQTFTAADLARLYKTLTKAFNAHFKTTEYEFCAPWCVEGGFEMLKWPGRVALFDDPKTFKQIRIKRHEGRARGVDISDMDWKTTPHTEWANIWLTDAKFGETKVFDFGDSFDLVTKSCHQHWTPAELRLFKSVVEAAGFVGPIKFRRFVKQQAEQTRAQKAASAEKDKKRRRKKTKTLPLRV